MKHTLLTLGAALLCAATINAAVVTWTGGGVADTSWGNNANWDVTPAWDGTDSATVIANFAGNTALTLDTNRSLARLTFGGGSTAISLSGNTLTLTSTTTTAALGAALWNANTSDNVGATVNSNILLQSGTAGSYTGHFRENNNSNGGTRFNGVISQGAGENWTLWFSRASARGNFYLNNASNSFSALRNAGADVYSEVAGAFGGAALTLAGGLTGTRVTDHYNTPVNNSITLTAASSWISQVQTRLTGSLTQAGNQLNYLGASNQLTRLDYSSVSGNGVTAINAATIAPSSMSQFATGTLNLNNNVGGQGVLVLSGAGGNGVPTWGDFIAARTFNQSGGVGTWRINLTAGVQDNVYKAGGFAAKGADLVIPHQSDPNAGGITNNTFTRNFFLGSAATLDGVRYANNAVRIETDIAYGTLTLGDRRYFGAAANAETLKSQTSMTLGGPVHELSGVISGENVIIYPMGGAGQSPTTLGLIRISNENNSLTGTSRWIIGGARDAFTTIGGGAIAASNNMGDLSTIGLIFTSDGAFGGATEVQVSSRGSSGTTTSGTLLLEDRNPGGPTTFTRPINIANSLVSSSSAPPAAFGSFGGDVIYTGALTFAGTNGFYLMHAQASSTLTFAGGASMTNDNSAATTFNKTGDGTLAINSLTVGGTQATNNWNVRAGTLLVNTTLASAITVSNGGTLGGSGTVSGAAVVQAGGTLAPGNSPGLLTFGTSLNLNANSFTVMEIDGTARGAGYDAVDVGGLLTYGGDMTVLVGTTFGAGTYAFDLFDFGSATGTYSTITIAGNYSGLLDSGNSWTYTDGIATWSFAHGTGVLALDVVPEPATYALLGGLAALGLALWRRRKQ